MAWGEVEAVLAEEEQHRREGRALVPGGEGVCQGDALDATRRDSGIVAALVVGDLSGAP